MSTPGARLLPQGVDVAFSDINTAITAGEGEPRRTPPRALSSTLVVIGPDERLNEAAETLERLSGHLSVRGLLISIGRDPRPTPRRVGETVALSGLSPAFVDNAVAALRLSSLPTIVWWRGGDPGTLDELARLADRVLLDDGEPREVWRRAAGLFETAGFSDLRWTRLTRWRTLLANFFDIAEVRAAAPAFTRLRVRGADRVAAELLTSWLAWALGRRGPLELAFEESHRSAFIEDVAFGDARDGIRLRLAASGTCVVTSANLDRHRCGARTVSLGDRSLSALLSEELRIRARDRAFEAAVLAWLERAEAGAPR